VNISILHVHVGPNNNNDDNDNNDIAFQSMTNHLQKCVSYPRMMFLLLWPWPWSDDLDIRTWHRYAVDVYLSVYTRNKISRWRLSKVRTRTRQTDTQRLLISGGMTQNSQLFISATLRF